MVPVLTFGQRQQALTGLPFSGKSDFNFVASKSPFSNGISIKLLPLADLSRPEAVVTDEFDIDRELLFNKNIKDNIKSGDIILFLPYDCYSIARLCNNITFQHYGIIIKFNNYSSKVWF